METLVDTNVGLRQDDFDKIIKDHPTQCNMISNIGQHGKIFTSTSERTLSESYTISKNRTNEEVLNINVNKTKYLKCVRNQRNTILLQ